MDEHEAYALMVRVLTVYDEADCQGDLYWRVYDGKVKLLATCNDTFYWATSDGEEITTENVGVLEQALRDLKAAQASAATDISAEIYVGELFAARVRCMRPQHPWYKDRAPELAALFNACGPERDRASEG